MLLKEKRIQETIPGILVLSNTKGFLLRASRKSPYTRHIIIPYHLTLQLTTTLCYIMKSVLQLIKFSFLRLPNLPLPEFYNSIFVLK